MSVVFWCFLVHVFKHDRQWAMAVEEPDKLFLWLGDDRTDDNLV